MRGTRSLSKSLSARQHVLIALVALLIGIGLLIYYVHQVPTLEPSVRNQVYYVALFPSAVACALALFGAMRGYARFTAKHPGIALELGGPVVLFVLILWGGFKIIPPSQGTFDLTVRAHSTDGTAPIIRTGMITLDLDNYRRTESFRPNGEADFKGIPAKFVGTIVNVLPQIDGYQRKWESHKIVGSFLDLALQQSDPFAFHGFIHDERGNPLPTVNVLSTDCNKTAVSNNQGVFVFQVSGTPAMRCHLIFTKDGYSSYNTDVVIDGDPDHRFMLRIIKHLSRGH